jgi:signal transduction histidine kinase
MPERSAKPGGSGIGLAISKQLANHLGGELALKHSSPHGCVFTLRLPCPCR